jgi:hypothetical protein
MSIRTRSRLPWIGIIVWATLIYLTIAEIVGNMTGGVR